MNGWKAAGIYDVLKMDAAALSSLDPFQDISTLPGNDDDDNDDDDMIMMMMMMMIMTQVESLT